MEGFATIGFDVDGHYRGAFRVEMSYFLLYFGGYLVGFLDGDVPVYLDVHVDDYVGPAATCAQMVKSLYALSGDDGLGYTPQLMLGE